MPLNSAPHMLPGNANKLPSPSKFRNRLATNAALTPYHRPSSTAQNTLTMCWTGAHRLPSIGNEMTLPITATAVSSDAITSLRVESFCIDKTPPKNLLNAFDHCNQKNFFEPRNILIGRTYN